MDAEVPSAQQAGDEQAVTPRDLVEAVSAVLFLADPVGINFETNTEEYDAEAEAIVIALPKATSENDVKALTHEVFVQWFDAQTAVPVEQYTAVARDIWNVWRRHQGQAGLSAE